MEAGGKNGSEENGGGMASMRGRGVVAAEKCGGLMMRCGGVWMEWMGVIYAGEFAESFGKLSFFRHCI